ncbi:transcription factor bHLH104-like, partial [Solanum verrucosum]|uniref:transcription factor bHLH104-like n=1 Tax=Solanum verrucosum TaxID=315347 RepID=UPI0020D0F168
KGNKACRERLRREKLNKRFSDLCSVLEPIRAVKTDKMAKLGDLNQLKTESEEYKEMNQKLIKTLKVRNDFNELREEKLALQREDGARVESASFIPPHPAAYQPDGHVPMWQYLQPSSLDTSQDHKLCCLRILQDNVWQIISLDGIGFD